MCSSSRASPAGPGGGDGDGKPAPSSAHAALPGGAHPQAAAPPQDDEVEAVGLPSGPAEGDAGPLTGASASAAERHRGSQRSRAKLIIDGAYLEGSIRRAEDERKGLLEHQLLLSLLEDRLEASFEKKVLYQATPSGEPNPFHRAVSHPDGAHVKTVLQPLKARTVTLLDGHASATTPHHQEAYLDKGVDLALALEILEPLLDKAQGRLSSSSAAASPASSSSSLSSAAGAAVAGPSGAGGMGGAANGNGGAEGASSMLVVVTGDGDLAPVMERAERAGCAVVVCGGRKTMSERLHQFVRKGAEGQAVWLEDLLEQAWVPAAATPQPYGPGCGSSSSNSISSTASSSGGSTAPTSPSASSPAAAAVAAAAAAAAAAASGVASPSMMLGGPAAGAGAAAMTPLQQHQQQQQQQGVGLSIIPQAPPSPSPYSHPHSPHHLQHAPHPHHQHQQQQHHPHHSHHPHLQTHHLGSPAGAAAGISPTAVAGGLHASLPPAGAGSAAAAASMLMPPLGLNPKQKLYRCPQGRFCDKLDEPGHLRALRHPCPKGHACRLAMGPAAAAAVGFSEAERRDHMLTFVHICPKGTACPRNDIEHCTHFDHPYRRTKARCPDGANCPFLLRGAQGSAASSSSSAREHSRVFRHPCPKGSACPLLAGKQPSEKKRYHLMDYTHPCHVGCKYSVDKEWAWQHFSDFDHVDDGLSSPSSASASAAAAAAFDSAATVAAAALQHAAAHGGHHHPVNHAAHAHAHHHHQAAVLGGMMAGGIMGGAGTPRHGPVAGPHPLSTGGADSRSNTTTEDEESVVGVDHVILEGGWNYLDDPAGGAGSAAGGGGGWAASAASTPTSAGGSAGLGGAGGSSGALSTLSDGGGGGSGSGSLFSADFFKPFHSSSSASGSGAGAAAAGGASGAGSAAASPSSGLGSMGDMAAALQQSTHARAAAAHAAASSPLRDAHSAYAGHHYHYHHHHQQQQQQYQYPHYGGQHPPRAPERAPASPWRHG